MSFRSWLVLLVVVLLPLSACGKKGPLYLPASLPPAVPGLVV